MLRLLSSSDDNVFSEFLQAVKLETKKAAAINNTSFLFIIPPPNIVIKIIINIPIEI